jgi:hypothetical protein
MILANELKALTELTAQGLTKLIRKAGYKEDTFVDCKFLGMTNSGQFCYLATYKGEFEDVCKVFVYQSFDGTLQAEY